MNWHDLNKEKKQLVFLIALLVVGGIIALYMFVLAPFFGRKTMMASELEDLKMQVQKADNIIGRDTLIRTELAKTGAELGKAMEQCVAPRDNPLSWVTEKIYRSAREVGMDIESVAEVSAAAASRDKQKQNDRVFAPYSVRIVTQSSYAQLVQLVEALEKSNPYLCVSGISIISQDRDPQKHSISMVVDWPMKTELPPAPVQPPTAKVGNAAN